MRHQVRSLVVALGLCTLALPVGAALAQSADDARQSPSQQAPSKPIENPGRPIAPPPVTQKPVIIVDPVRPPVTPPNVPAPSKPVVPVRPPVTPPNVPAPSKPVVPVRPPVKPVVPVQNPGCARVAYNLERALNHAVGSFVNRLGFNLHKKVLGVSLGLQATPPKLNFQTAVQGAKIVVRASVVPGVMRGSINAGVFGQHQGAVNFPARAVQLQVAIPCASNCASFSQLVVEQRRAIDWLVNVVNTRLLGALPPTIQIGALEAGITWPRIALRGNAQPRGFVVELSRWGARYAKYDGIQLAFADKLVFPAHKLTFTCPSGTNPDPTPPPTPPNPNVPPTTDNELSCHTRIPHKLHFFTDKFQVDPKYKQNAARLQELRAAIHTVPKGCRMEIIGHTDCQGTHAYNVGLSQRRANSVHKWVLANGVAPHLRGPGMMADAGRSFSQPYCKLYRPKPSIRMNAQCTGRPGHATTTDGNNACMVANRRVEFVLVPAQK